MTLQNFQTLKLKFCKSLRKLPERIGELSNLRHLEVLGATGLCCFPQSIGRLSHLQTLNKFIVNAANGRCIIEELGNLSYLKGNLEITGLRKVENMNEAKRAELQRKKNLHFLELDFGFFDDATKDDIQRMDGAIQALQPHTELEQLVIKGYPGSMFPCRMSREIGESGESTQQQEMSLESLSLRGLHAVKHLSAELLGNRESRSTSSMVIFPKLTKLEIEIMPEWEEQHFDILVPMKSNTISGSGGTASRIIMPSLEALEISNCPKLKVVPHYMFSRSLKKLVIRECPGLIGMQHCLPQSFEHLELLRDLGALSKSLTPVTLNHNNGYPNLKYLQIGYSPCSSLPQGLNQLTSLQDLVVSNCMFLDFNPECLRILPMLSKLETICCQLLRERSREDWNIISHIPNITIDFKKLTQTN
ncbi:hypothetical protein IFM89_002179 [Coptis chinensis]|uniref:R13L1/DRL21-like LRR repeat region domain-containing protein n=1 Tax=Coptis chinensis TaxID=261450 RepID=A0A835IB11_9MAGN|nr:hypothetical protein IFM89_002179 [Coptis chinensis]